MAEKKIIAVVGATGAQGGGLARALLRDTSGAFSVRAITRKPDSDKARELAKSGADIVRADLDDAKSMERAFAGTYGAFCLTNFWEHFSGEKEFTQGATLAGAAKKAGVEHAIWSTFEDTRRWVPLSDSRMPTLQGKYKVPHFDAKAEADAVFKELGVPTTFLLTSFYWENFIYFGAGPKKGPDGVLTLTFPLADKKLPAIAVEDIGKCVVGIFKKGPELIGKTIGISGSQPTGAQMAESMTRALGQKVRYQDVPADVYRSFGFPGADEMGNMLQFKRDFNEYYCGIRNPDASRALNPELQDLDMWLSRYKDRIPLA